MTTTTLNSSELVIATPALIVERTTWRSITLLVEHSDYHQAVQTADFELPDAEFEF